VVAGQFPVTTVSSMGGYWSTLDGALIFALDQLSDFPAGTYTLGMEYRHNGANEIQSVGHTITVAIIDSPGGKRLSIPLADNKNKKMAPGFLPDHGQL
jgi:hypothetical protein